MWKGCVLVKAPFSDIHLRFTRKKSMVDYSDSICFLTLPRARGSNAGTLNVPVVALCK